MLFLTSAEQLVQRFFGKRAWLTQFLRTLQGSSGVGHGGWLEALEKDALETVKPGGVRAS